MDAINFKNSIYRLNDNGLDDGRERVHNCCDYYCDSMNNNNMNNNNMNNNNMNNNSMNNNSMNNICRMEEDYCDQKELLTLLPDQQGLVFAGRSQQCSHEQQHSDHREQQLLPQQQQRVQQQPWEFQQKQFQQPQEFQQQQQPKQQQPFQEPTNSQQPEQRRSDCNSCCIHGYRSLVWSSPIFPEHSYSCPAETSNNNPSILSPPDSTEMSLSSNDHCTEYIRPEIVGSLPAGLWCSYNEELGRKKSKENASSSSKSSLSITNGYFRKHHSNPNNVGVCKWCATSNTDSNYPTVIDTEKNWDRISNGEVHRQPKSKRGFKIDPGYFLKLKKSKRAKRDITKEKGISKSRSYGSGKEFESLDSLLNRKSNYSIETTDNFKNDSINRNKPHSKSLKVNAKRLFQLDDNNRPNTTNKLNTTTATATNNNNNNIKITKGTINNNNNNYNNDIYYGCIGIESVIKLYIFVGIFLTSICLVPSYIVFAALHQHSSAVTSNNFNNINDNTTWTYMENDSYSIYSPWISYHQSNTNTTSKYSILRKPASFNQSQQTCIDLGGHLVHVNSLREQLFLEELIIDYLKNQESSPIHHHHYYEGWTSGFWLGAQKMADVSEFSSCLESQWTWDDGGDRRRSGNTIGGMTAFVPGKPDNYHGHENCLYMSQKDGLDENRYLKWDDTRCDDEDNTGPIIGICEIDL